MIFPLHEIYRGLHTRRAHVVHPGPHVFLHAPLRRKRGQVSQPRVPRFLQRLRRSFLEHFPQPIHNLPRLVRIVPFLVDLFRHELSLKVVQITRHHFFKRVVVYVALFFRSSSRSILGGFGYQHVTASSSQTLFHGRFPRDKVNHEVVLVHYRAQLFVSPIFKSGDYRLGWFPERLFAPKTVAFYRFQECDSFIFFECR